MADNIFDDPIIMEQVVRAIERASDTIEDIADQVDVITTATMAAAKKFEVEIDVIEKKVKTVENTSQTGIKRTQSAWEAMYRKLNDELGQQDRKWRSMIGYIETHLSRAGGMLGSIAMGTSGSKGIFSALQSAAGSILSQLPMGGFIGVMLYGAQRAEGFRATSTSIIRTLDQIGGYTKSQAASVQRDVVKMFLSWGSQGEEVLATMQKLAEFNLGGAQFHPVSGQKGAEVRQVLTAVDLASKMQAGTSAGVAGAAFEASGKPIEEITERILELRGAAKDAGVGMVGLMSTLTQGLSSLRLQRQGVGDLANAYFSLRKNLMAHTGMTGDQASLAAMKGLNVAAQGISSMNEGLMGYVAQKIHDRTGRGPSDPFEAMMSLRLGETTGAQGDYMKQVAQELQEIIKGQFGGVGKAGQIGILGKMGGFSDEQSRAILELGGGATLDEVAAAFKDPQKVMADAFKKRSDEANTWEMKMANLLFGISQIGQGLLTIVVAAVRGYGAAAIHLSHGEKKLAEEVWEKMLDAQEAGGTRVVSGLKKVGGVFQGSVEELGKAASFETNLDRYNTLTKKTGRALGQKIAQEVAVEIAGDKHTGIEHAEFIKDAAKRGRARALAIAGATITAKTAEYPAEAAASLASGDTSDFAANVIPGFNTEITKVIEEKKTTIKKRHTPAHHHGDKDEKRH